MTNATLDLISLRPITVPQLGHPALILHDHKLILVDSEADLEEVADWALARSAQLLAEESAQ